MAIPVPTYGSTFQGTGGGLNVYDPNTGKPLAGAGAYNPNNGLAINQSPSIPPTPITGPNQSLINLQSNGPTAVSPVITAAAAQKDYESKLDTFNKLQGSISQQKSVLAQQAAQRAADDAQKAVEASKQQLEQQKLGIAQQTADSQAKEAEAKRIALGMSDSTTVTRPLGAIPPPTPEINVTTPGVDSQQGDPYQNSLSDAANQKIGSLQSIQDARDQYTQQSNQLLSSLAAGTIPLSQPQQALISSLQNQLIQNENDQKQANASYTGSVTEAGFRAGGEYTPEQYAGQIHATVSLGVQKIQNLDNSAAKTIADLEQSFQKDNYEIINKQYDNLFKTLDDKADAIKDTYDTVTSAIKDQRDYAASQTKAASDQKQQDFENRLNSSKFTYQQKQDAIDNAFKAGQISETQRHNLAMESIQKEPTAAEQKAAAKALQNAKGAIPVMQDKIDAAEALKNSAGLNSRVGTGIFSRTSKNWYGAIGKASTIVGLPGTIEDATDKYSGAGNDFAAGVHKLTNGLTLQNLIDAKAQGATFGALSEGELNLLADSATKISDWEIKDGKGNGEGIWNIDEKDFIKEIDNIQNLTRRAIQLSGQQLVDDGEDYQLNQTFSSQQTQQKSTDPAAYY